jgi:hypothetical protein
VACFSFLRFPHPLITDIIMKRYFSCVALLWVLLAQTSFGQISHATGWYAEDSILITVKPKSGHTTWVAVNSFSQQAFKPYTGDFWVYARPDAINTWEDQQLTKGPVQPWQTNIDTSVKRGVTPKAVTVRVQYRDPNGSVDKEYVSALHLTGAKEPGKRLHGLPVVHIFVDSLDAFGPEGFYGPGDGVILPTGEHFWNYEIDGDLLFASLPRSRYEKNAVMQILDTTNVVTLNQACGARISGKSSVNYPNRTIACVARDEYGPKKFKTRLYGAEGEYKWIKLRTRPDQSFGYNEIGLSIIQGAGLGEVAYRPVIVYLNGSYWTIAFAQDKVNEYSAGAILDADKDSVCLAKLSAPMPLDSSFHEMAQVLGFDTAEACAFVTKGADRYLVSLIEAGEKRIHETWAQQFFERFIFAQGPIDTFGVISGLMDVDAVARYISFINFAGITDAMSNNVLVTNTPGGKASLMAKDFDNMLADAEMNSWTAGAPFGDSLFMDDVTKGLIRNVFLKNKPLAERVLLVYEDMLNTFFAPERTVPVAVALYDAVLPEYELMKASWGPNAMMDTADAWAHKAVVADFLNSRPVHAWEQIATTWAPLLGDNYTLQRRNTVRVCMDSVPEGSVQVHLNSLTIGTTWQGLYYPRPMLDISAKAAPGYTVRWKEYPDSTSHLALSADNPVTLTPVLIPDTVSGIAGPADVSLHVAPNPASGTATIVTDIAFVSGTLTGIYGGQALAFAGNVINTRDIANGLYVVALYDREGTRYTVKLVVAH